MGLVELLVPPTSTAIGRAIDGADLYLKLHGEKIPLKIRVLWVGELRPALVEWKTSLERKP